MSAAARMVRMDRLVTLVSMVSISVCVWLNEAYGHPQAALDQPNIGTRIEVFVTADQLQSCNRGGLFELAKRMHEASLAEVLLLVAVKRSGDIRALRSVLPSDSVWRIVEDVRGERYNALPYRQVLPLAIAICGTDTTVVPDPAHNTQAVLQAVQLCHTAAQPRTAVKETDADRLVSPTEMVSFGKELWVKDDAQSAIFRVSPTTGSITRYSPDVATVLDRYCADQSRDRPDSTWLRSFFQTHRPSMALGIDGFDVDSGSLWIHYKGQVSPMRSHEDTASVAMHWASILVRIDDAGRMAEFMSIPIDSVSIRSLAIHGRELWFDAIRRIRDTTTSNPSQQIVAAFAQINEDRVQLEFLTDTTPSARSATALARARGRRGISKSAECNLVLDCGNARGYVVTTGGVRRAIRLDSMCSRATSLRCIRWDGSTVTALIGDAYCVFSETAPARTFTIPYRPSLSPDDVLCLGDGIVTRLYLVDDTWTIQQIPVF